MRRVGTVSLSVLRAEGRVVLPYPPSDVLVIHSEAGVFAIEDACNHAGVSLLSGEVSRQGTCIVCPMHGFVFRLDTGALVEPQACAGDQRAYRVDVVGDEVHVWDDETPFILT